MKLKVALLAASLVLMQVVPARAVDCQPGDLQPIRDALAELAKLLSDLQKQARCSDSNVLCLDLAGHPVEGETLPDIISSGSELTVVAIVPKGDKGRISITTTFETDPNSLFEKAIKPAAAGAHALAPCQTTEDQHKELLAAVEHLEIPAVLGEALPDKGDLISRWAQLLKDLGGYRQASNDTVEIKPAKALLIKAVRFDADQQARVPLVHRIPINAGRYFADVGVLFPMIIGGGRKYYVSEDAGTGERRIARDDAPAFSAAAMLQVFPFGGRPKNQVSTWGDHLGLLTTLGLQIGTAIAKPGSEFYVGGVFEPFSGFSFNAGVVYAMSTYLPGDKSVGDYIPRGDTVKLRSGYLPFPYVGFTLSADVLNMIRSVD